MVEINKLNVKIKKILFSLVLLVGAWQLSAQTVELKGRVTDKVSNLPVAYAVVTVLGTGDVITSDDGLWNISVATGDSVSVSVDAWGYQPYDAKFKYTGALVDIYLTPASSSSYENKADLTVIVVEEEGDDAVERQSSAAILSSSMDVFDRTAAYEFGSMRFRNRGLDSRYYNLWFNGAPVNDMESGRASWGTFGGLNDAVRNQETTVGMSNADYDFGNVAGSGYIHTSPFGYRPGIKASYSLANRNYRNRLMVTYSTGALKGDWALTFSGSKRWAEEGYIPGTFYDAYAAFLSAGKKFGNTHELTLTAFAAPSRSGRNSAITQEAAELTGSNYYNPYWGYQGDFKRNQRVSSYFEPTTILNHKWLISDKTSLTTTLSYIWAKNGYTSLNWLNGTDPRPDYYRYMPSYYKNDPTNYALMYNKWVTDGATGQVNWQQIYDANRQQRTVFGVNGNPGESFTGVISNYIIEDRITEKNMATANMVFSHSFSNRLKVNAGANYRWYSGRHYNEVADLLGGDYFYDVDKFAERDFVDVAVAYNDLNNPGRILREGDRYSHDYAANIRTWQAWAEGKWSIAKFDAFLSASVTGTEFWREGFTRKGLFPDNSFGLSETKTFTDYGLQAGFDYKISGRHILRFNGLVSTQAPTFQNAFVSPRTRNQMVDNLQNENIISGEASYIFRLPSLTGRITGYYSTFNDNTEVISFYHDTYQNLLNYVISGIDTRHTGLEAGFEYTVMDGLKTTGVIALGEYIYTSRPTVEAFVDNKAEQLVEESGLVYAKGFYVSGTPMTAVSWGMNYRSPKYWWMGFNTNYLGNNYLDFNPARRTTAAVEGLDLTNADDYTLYHKIIDQERISAAFYTNVFVGKSWYMGDYYVVASLNVSNIFNNTDMVTGGFEQYRFDYAGKDPQKYPNKYYYAYGANYFLNVSVSF